MADPTTSCVAHLQDAMLPARAAAADAYGLAEVTGRLWALAVATQGHQARPGGPGHIVGLPGVKVTAETKRAALTAARTAIATALEVDPESFDLE